MPLFTAPSTFKVTDAGLKQLFNNLPSRAGRYGSSRLARKLAVLASLVVAVGYGLLQFAA
ncbi:hypothetical protein [Paludibacterium denitrificans]|uniref:Uncharacterized protein n=1 Tax=Paludibacterium denitrificans TaxID=2675226 RepID=A0A844GFC5_9NEIS|nr:hypothetical protein [Paludibacterium denitrificans]MTD33597.1 hypothetical protein [Paludibacterium denitrificans]